MAGTGNVRRNDASNDPRPAMGLCANAIANQQGKEDTDSSRRSVHECSLLRGVPEVPD